MTFQYWLDLVIYAKSKVWLPHNYIRYLGLKHKYYKKNNRTLKTLYGKKPDNNRI